MMILVKCKSIQGLYCLLKRTPSESAFPDKTFVLRPTNVGQGLFLCGQQPSLHLLLRFASSAPLAFAISQAWESITKGSQSRFSKE